MNKKIAKKDKAKDTAIQGTGRKVDKRSKSLKRISILSTIIFIAVVLVFNVLFDNLLGDKLKWDWTTGDQYSIGDVSREILGQLEKDVEIVGLFGESSNQQYQRVMPMLEAYIAAGRGKIKVRYVDPDRFPNILHELDPTGNLKPEANEFVVSCAQTQKAKRIGYYDIFDITYNNAFEPQLQGVTAEQSFTGAINYVISETTPVVYFTAGQDEEDYQENYTVIASLLQNNNYEVKTIDLFGLEAIPGDCSALIMLSPQRDVSEDARRLLERYLKQGGSLMVVADYSKLSFPELNILLSDYNVEIGDTRIREGDPNYRYQDDPYNIRAIAPVSTVTENRIDGFTLVDNARGMNVLSNVKEWIDTESVLTTSEQGVAETGGDTDRSSEAGAQDIILLSENRGYIDNANVTVSAKVMLVGSKKMFSDEVLSRYGTQLYNVGLFFYSVQYLANVDDATSLYIPPKKPVNYEVTKGSGGTNVVTAVFVTLILPGLLLLTALIVYRKRKHL